MTMAGGRIAIAGVALLASATSAHAQAERLALVGADSELERATLTVLSPWNVEVVTPAIESPGAAMPEAADRAEAMAAAHSARAVVWIASTPREPTLWLYDVSSRRTMALRLSAGPPFDPLGAAAVALTIKTLLRYSQIAPVEERFAAPPPPGETLTLEARGGLLGRLDPAPPFEPRIALAIAFRPRRGGRLALTLELDGGPGFAIERSDFVGHYSDQAISVGLRAGFRLGRRIRLSPALGGSLHVAHVTGTAVVLGKSADAWHVNPAVNAGLILELEGARRLRVGLVAHGSYLVRRQRFLVGSDEVFDIPAVEGGLSLAVSVPIL